jgi:hypothetical protein
MDVGFILAVAGVLIAGVSWSIRNHLRQKYMFPTRLSNTLEILGPLVGFAFVVLGVIVVLLG